MINNLKFYSFSYIFLFYFIQMQCRVTLFLYKAFQNAYSVWVFWKCTKNKNVVNDSLTVQLHSVYQCSHKMGIGVEFLLDTATLLQMWLFDFN